MNADDKIREVLSEADIFLEQWCCADDREELIKCKELLNGLLENIKDNKVFMEKHHKGIEDRIKKADSLLCEASYFV